MEKQEVIALVERQISEQVALLGKGEYVTCYQLGVRRKFRSRRRGCGEKTVIGFMTPKELKAHTHKAGFFNGHLALRPTVLQLDHDLCRLPRYIIPVKHILDVKVEILKA